MSIGFVGSTSHDMTGATGALGDTLSLTGLSGGLGTSPAAGDCIFVIIHNCSNTRRTNAAEVTGYTRVYNSLDIFSNGTYDANLTVWYKVMGPTPDSDFYAKTTDNSFDASTVHAFVLRGVDTTSPLDVTPTQATGSGSNPDPAAITPVTSGSLILVCGTAAFASSDISGAGLSEAYSSNALSSEARNSGNDWSVAARTGTVEWTGGAYDPGVMTGTGFTGNRWAAATLAIRPSSAVSIPTLGTITTTAVTSDSISFSLPVTY